MDVSVIFITLAFSAFFSGMEIAFVASNKLRVGLDIRRDDLTGSILSLFYKNTEKFISTLLVGNNIALVVYGIAIAENLQGLLSPYITHIGVMLLAQTTISTVIVLLTAEFLPKTIFRINPNFWLRLFALPMVVIYVVLYPISTFTTHISKVFLRLMGVRFSSSVTNRAFGKVDLDYFIQQSIDSQLDNDELDPEVKIFQKVLDFSSVKIRDCVVPRPEIVAVEWDTPLPTLLERFTETGFSKIVVYRDSIDNIVGYIHSSELFLKPEDWHTRISPVSMVPESMSASQLMKQFLQQKRSLAVVVDEFGGTAGIIALEDILEEIIGDIEDEHDQNTPIARKVMNHEYVFSGRAEVAFVNEKFGLDIPEEDSYQTIAGYILHELNKMPQVNEEVKTPKYLFKVVKVSDSRIDIVRMKEL